MGILDGIVEWIAEQVMYGLDLINTSVLGALGCNMSTFLRYFPAAETMYHIFVALAIGMILLNLIWQLFKNYSCTFARRRLSMCRRDWQKPSSRHCRQDMCRSVLRHSSISQ